MSFSKLSIGIIGLPNVGKSSLFNALLESEQALVANYPFATIEPNVGVVSVPDQRLEKLARWFDYENPPPVTPAAITFIDIAGLVKGAAEGQGLGNKFLSHIKNVSIILEVIRDFGDAEIVREHSVNPEKDAEIIDTELRLQDLETIEKKLESFKKEPLKKEEFLFLSRLKEKISGISAIEIPGKDIKNEKIASLLKEMNLLSLKPKIYAFNSDAPIPAAGNSPANFRGRPVVYVSAKTGKNMDNLIKLCFQTLDLISFLTVGQKESRAWTIKKGAKAREAAGVIHSDFEKKFIRAKVINWEKLLSAESFADAASKGLIRTEGKDYEIQDGDVVEFLVNK